MLIYNFFTAHLILSVLYPFCPLCMCLSFHLGLNSPCILEVYLHACCTNLYVTYPCLPLLKNYLVFRMDENVEHWTLDAVQSASNTGYSKNTSNLLYILIFLSKNIFQTSNLYISKSDWRLLWHILNTHNSLTMCNTKHKNVSKKLIKQ